MELVTENGSLDLPRDFSFELERTNPFLSDAGDATVPATLPASRNNRVVLDNIHRIDRIGNSLVDIPALLKAGSIVKHGRLIIDSAHRQDGYDVSFAIENSSLYCQFKNKTIKQIFAEFNNGQGYQDGTHVGISNIVTYLENVYRGNYQGTDYTIFPIAVSKYEQDEREFYQYNNEFNSNSLVYGVRVVREGDVSMTVPEGYGVSPLIYLHRMLTIMFVIMGYSVSSNCFHSGWMSQLVLLNNCSDTIVNGVIKYEDLVPSCTLSEFLEWLQAKFHVQVRVDSEDKQIFIEKMEDLLTGSADDDFSEAVEGDPKMTFAKSSRVVLSSATSIDGAAPAAKTFDELIEKYGGYFTLREAVYAAMQGGTFQYHDCLTLRVATGEFFEIRTNLNTAKDELIRLGTNYFTYDRNNSDDAEDFGANDEMPPMIAEGKFIAPYVGERTHAHTTFNDSEKDTKQPIIVVQESFPSSEGYYQLRLGTTQNIVPKNTASDLELTNGLTTYMMYDTFWAVYNKQLRNNLVTITAKMMLPQYALANLNMSRLKMYRNQKLLPKSFRMPISDHPQLSECEFLLIKDNGTLVEDTPVVPDTPARLKWSFKGSQALDDLWATLCNSSYGSYENLYGQPYDNGLLYDVNLDLISPAGMHAPTRYIAKPTGDYDIVFTDGIEKLYAHTPQSAGETSPATIRYFTMRVKMSRYNYDASAQTHYGTFHDYYYIDFENQHAAITCVSETY